MEKHISVRRTTDDEPPLISVVIPSRQRPDLLIHSVQSVIDQKRDDMEIVVVLDGDTAGSAQALRREFSDTHCVRVIESVKRQGVSVARNLGVQATRGKWIAFHDDDDLWLPGKLDKQMKLALASRYAEPVVSCQLSVNGGRRIWPKRSPSHPMSEYLYSCRGLSLSTGVLPPPVIVTLRSLCVRVPFTPGLPKHEDGEWVMLIGQEPTVGFEFVAEPLVIYNCRSDGRERITGFHDWRYSLEFARSRRSLMTSGGYAGFILSRCIYSACYSNAWSKIPLLYAEAFRHGKPSFADVLSAICTCLRGIIKSALRAFRLIRRAEPAAMPQSS